MTKEEIINSFTDLVNHMEQYDRDIIAFELKNITIDVERLHETLREENKQKLYKELTQVIDKIQKSDFYISISGTENPSIEIEMPSHHHFTIDIS